MVEDVVLFVTLAQIAGVFVGFAALISVTRSEIKVVQLSQIRAVVTIGLVVVVAALMPVALDAYDTSPHALWLISSVIYLLLNWAVIFLSLRRPENRRLATGQVRTSPVMAGLFWLLEVPIQVPLLLVVFDVDRGLDQAFYTTAVVFHLFEAAFVLAQLVYAQVGNLQE